MQRIAAIAWPSTVMDLRNGAAHDAAEPKKKPKSIEMTEEEEEGAIMDLEEQFQEIEQQEQQQEEEEKKKKEEEAKSPEPEKSSTSTFEVSDEKKPEISVVMIKNDIKTAENKEKVEEIQEIDPNSPILFINIKEIRLILNFPFFPIKKISPKTPQNSLHDPSISSISFNFQFNVDRKARETKSHKQ